MSIVSEGGGEVVGTRSVQGFSLFIYIASIN